MLDNFADNHTFIKGIITGDETWTYNNDEWRS